MPRKTTPTTNHEGGQSPICHDGGTHSDNMADPGDDIVVDEDFGSTRVTVSHDHAGNLVDDGTFRHVYDAWNRLVTVKSSLDSAATTFQTAQFDGLALLVQKGP